MDQSQTGATLIIKKTSCSEPGHNGQPLELICTKGSCPRRGLICYRCAEIQHTSHLGEVVTCATFLDACKEVPASFDAEHHSTIKQYSADISQTFAKSIEDIRAKLNSLEEMVKNHADSLENQTDLAESNNTKVIDAFQNFEQLSQFIKKHLHSIGVKNNVCQVKRHVEIYDVGENEIGLRTTQFKEKLAQATSNIQKEVETVRKLMDSAFDLKKLQIMRSENRYQWNGDGWAYEQNTVDAISFTSQANNLIRLDGVGIQNVQNWGSHDTFEFKVAVQAGSTINTKDVIYQQSQELKEEDWDNETTIIDVKFEEPVDVKPGQKQTVAIIQQKVYQGFETYCGTAGVDDVQSFIFSNVENLGDLLRNHTNVEKGQIPYMYYQIM